MVLAAAAVSLAGLQVAQIVGAEQSARASQRALAHDLSSSLPVVHTEVAPAPPTFRAGAAIARLKIPSIGVDLVVVEGVGEASLAKGPGHYPGSALPGRAGVTAIGGHRNGWGSPFLDLDRVRTGDVVTLIDGRGTHRYRVTGSTVVDPDEVWVLRGDPASRARARLALTTCTPKFTSRQRLVVWGDLMPDEPARPMRAR